MYIMYFSQGYWDIVLKLHWYYVYCAVPCCIMFIFRLLAYMYTYKWLLWMVYTCTHINVHVPNSLYWTEEKLGLCIQICRLWVHWQSPCVVKQTWIAFCMCVCMYMYMYISLAGQTLTSSFTKSERETVWPARLCAYYACILVGSTANSPVSHVAPP